MLRNLCLGVTAAALTGFGIGTGHSAEPPKVVVSIAPVHSLVAGVMRGVGTPVLLLKGGASPHTYALRPSDAKALASARAIFWVGEDLERFLERPLRTLGRNARKVELMEAKGISVLKLRQGGIWGKHVHGHEEHGEEGHGKEERGEQHEHEHAHVHGNDPHIWLDPRNAKAMTAAIVSALTQVDPGNAATYRANGAKLSARLDSLDRELEAALGPVRTAPYVVFHDAYQYFERRYRLAAAGAITIDPSRTPGARRLTEIRKTIQQRHARCVFAEPQFQPSLIATVIEGSSAHAATLDPLGASIEPGEDAYFHLMRELSKNLIDCLKGNS
jgi:zinc transport system substrate-binding protein